MHGLSIPKRLRTLAGTFKISSFVAGIIFLALSPLAIAESHLPTPGETFDKMSVEQRVGQVFIWTYFGTSFSPMMQSWLEKYQPGALIVFSRNIQNAAQIAKFNSDTQKFAAKKLKTPFLLMIDQEGGTVTRLHTSVPLPSALALGKMDDLKFITNFGKANGEVLRSVGFNVNLAPVLDISNPDKNSFIGNRAFGEDPDAVADMARAYSEGLGAAGIIPTAKHFPGHGGVVQDSHQTTPKKLATYDELAEKDLIPFEEYAHMEIPKALMMAHLALPNIDPSGLPSTYSNVLIQQTLRAKLKYEGLVLTDDLEMVGASTDQAIGERAVRAFLAGNDMLMLAGSPAHQKQAFAAMVSAVTSGRVSAARLKETVLRILTYKQEIHAGTVLYDDKKTKTSISALDSLSREVLKLNFTLSHEGKVAQWPDVNTDTKVLVLSSDRRFFQGFQSAFKGSAKFFLLTPESLKKVGPEIAQEKYAFAIFYASGAQTAHWLTNLSPEMRAKTIVVNANHTGEVEAQNSFLSVLTINSHNPECGFSLGEFLTTPEVRVPASSEVAPPESQEN